jgi:hypothetical protein
LSDAEGVGDLEVAGVGEDRRLHAPPQYDHREPGPNELEVRQYPLPPLRIGGVEAVGDAVAPEGVSELLAAGRSPRPDDPDGFEAASPACGPLGEEIRDRAMELLIRGCLREDQPVVDTAERDGLEHGIGSRPVAPANHREALGRRVKRARPSQELETIMVSAPETGDDERYWGTRVLELLQPLESIVGDPARDDRVVLAVAFDQLMGRRPARLRVAAHH